MDTKIGGIVMDKTTLSRLKQNVMAGVTAVSAAYWQLRITYSDAFETAEKAVSNTQNKLVNLAKVLFPFSLVILIIAILFTHDPKALAVELKTALIICVAYVALLLITSSGFVDTFSGLIQ